MRTPLISDEFRPPNSNRFSTRAGSAVLKVRRGVTLLEVLIGSAVVGLLLAMIVPAVQSARETARNAACKNQLRRIGLAIQQYESTHAMFPPGNNGHGLGSLFYCMLPYLDEQPLYERVTQAIREGRTKMDPQVRALQRIPLPILDCPSESLPQVETGAITRTSYAGNGGTGVQRYGYNGLFRYNSEHNPESIYPMGPIRIEDVHDGLSHTAAVSEWLHGHWKYARLRTVWRTPRSYRESPELEDFAALCASVPADPLRYGWEGNSSGLGETWVTGSLQTTLYNHVLPRISRVAQITPTCSAAPIRREASTPAASTCCMPTGM